MFDSTFSQFMAQLGFSVLCLESADGNERLIAENMAKISLSSFAITCTLLKCQILFSEKK